MLSGLDAYRDRWPGEVLLLVETGGLPGPNLGSLELALEDLPVAVVTTTDLAAALSATAPAIVSAALDPRHARLLDGRTRVVLTAEFSRGDRLRTSLLGATSARARVRVRLGHERQSRTLRSMVRRAAGVQSNGWPAHEDLGKMSSSPRVFFDTRLRADEVPDAVRHRTAPAAPLRLGFSARFVPAKGALDAVHVHRALLDLGVEATLDVFGEGPLAGEMRAQAAPGTTFHGVVDFHDTWVPFVRDELDLMLFPHVVGDPSGTYLEAAGLGVPSVGYANSALAGLVRHDGLGWTAPVGNVAGLARRIAELVDRPRDIEECAARGMAFMRIHDADSEMEVRIDHLRELAQR